MLVSRPILTEYSENLKSSCFMHSNGIPHSVPMPGVGHQPTVGNIEDVSGYSAGKGCFIPGQIQNDFSSVNMYPSQPSGSSLGSPDSYGFVPGSAASAPGLMGSHYNGEAEHSSHYPSLIDGCEMKAGVGDMWSGGYGQPLISHYPYGNAFGSQYHYERYCGMDINEGVRRKNATRESTNTLKNWLQEHKKNPYPTKGEKIMLAIVTKMTLTQVSTWFANARRRLKKENKMTWVPKNRSNDANSAGGKKVEDDDDSASQHSPGSAQKSDEGSADDCDDVVEPEVTSKNSNDVTSTSQARDSRECPTVKNENAKNSTNENNTQYVSPPLKSEVDTDDKASWATWKARETKGAAEMHQNFNIRQTFHSEDEYNTSSMNIKPQPSILSPSLMMGHVDNTRLPSNCKFSPHWSTTGYQDIVANNAVSSSRVQVERSSKDIDSLRHRSPRMTDAKPFASNPMFPINRPQESISEATSSIMTSSYLHGFPNQTQPIGNYRSSDQLPLPQSSGMNPAYYSQQDMSLRSDVHNPERIPSSYPASRDDLQSKMGPTSIVPVASPNSPEEKQLFHRQVHHINSSGAYYPAGHLCKPATSASVETSFSSPFYQQETYNQLPPHLQATNTDYYPRKNDQMSGYSGSDGSPFPLQASASPRK